MLPRSILSFFSTVLVLVSGYDYEGLKDHKVIRLSNVGDQEFLDLQLLDLDIWSRNRERQELVAHVNPDQFELISLLPEYKVIILDNDLEKSAIQDVKRAQGDGKSGSRILDDKSWFTEYHKYDEIKAWYKSLALSDSERITFVPSIGKTHQGRDIFALHIGVGGRSEGKKQIWIQGLIHAREWISGAVVQFLSKRLTEDRTTFSNVEFIIIPIVNPDGYEHTWSQNRLWRKNMAPNIIGKGVDLNRNFNDHWGEGGASNLPISDTYRGTQAASEPETRAIQDYFLKQKNVVGAIDWHCYSQLILYPYGWTRNPIKNVRQYEELGEEMTKAFHSLHGRQYIAEQSNSLYPTSGSASDWFVGKNRETKYVPFSLAIELPPAENVGSGFLLDPKFIVPVGEESWEAFKVFIDYTTKNSISRGNEE